MSNEELVVVGTLGVLARAKNQGLISAVKPHIEAMETQGRSFDKALVEKILRHVGE